ncbi:MAG: hypothetical protein J6W87_02750, partial [Clostridia bacterium]|nr:hypothetical protein [Clostridia bacterium]
KDSMKVLDANCSVAIFPEDSEKGYFSELKKIFSGFVTLADAYFRKTGEDVPVIPVYYGKERKAILIGKPLSVRDMAESGLKREEIAEKFRLAINGL